MFSFSCVGGKFCSHQIFQISRRNFLSRQISSSLNFSSSNILSPAVQFLIRSENLDPQSIKGSGKDGRIQKFDVIKAIKNNTAKKLTKKNESKGNSTNNNINTVNNRWSDSGRRVRKNFFIDQQKLSNEKIDQPKISVPESPNQQKSQTRRSRRIFLQQQ